MPEREAWARQPKETSRAYKAFSIYRKLGPRHRSHAETAKCYYEGKSRVYLGRMAFWSSRYDWVSRARAFDEFVDEQKRQADLDALLEMSERQASLGSRLQELGALMLEGLMEKAAPGNVLDTVRSLRTGAEIERLARGMPTQIVEEQGVERDFLVIIPPGEKAED